MRAITALLTETEETHGAYETNILGGVFFEAWPTWYGAYLLDRGLGDYLPGAKSLDVAILAAVLKRLAADDEQGDMASPWPDVYARRIVAGFRLGSGGEESTPASYPEVQNPLNSSTSSPVV